MSLGQELSPHLPFLRRYARALVDILGSSEGTGMARQVSSRRRKAATARFELGEHSRVFTDDGRDVVPGSGEIGRVALGLRVWVFRSRDFRWLLLARLCTNLALQMATVAIGWLVYDLTRDPLYLGFVGLAQFLPSVFLVLLSGSVAM